MWEGGDKNRNISRDKILGTPIQKLAMVKRFKVLLILKYLLRFAYIHINYHKYTRSIPRGYPFCTKGYPEDTLKIP